MALLGKRKADKADVGHSSADAAPAAKKQQHQRQTNRQGGRPYNSQGGGKGPAVLGRADRAALRKERRASKPHSDIIENANQLYRFDFKRMEAIERRVKIAELMERCAGKVADVLTKHDTSRVFQLMVKYGSGEQRQQLSAACKGSMVALCVNHYAHHFILKLLQYGSPLVRQAVWRELQGHVAQLAFHADGAVVFDYLYASEKSKKLQMDMTRELLHPTFALEAQTNALTAPDNSSARSGGGGGGGSLAELCESQPTIAASMVEQVRGLLEKWLNKNQLQYRFVHAIARQYLELPATVLPRLTRADFISALCSSPSLSALCASNDGVLTLCAAVSDGAAKDRKQVMRCLRSDALTVCRSLYGHLLLMRVVDCVDDTVAVAKNVWSSLLSDPHAVAQLINDVHGAKVVRFMLHGKPSSQFLSPFEAKFQSAPQQPSQPSQPSQDTADGSLPDASTTGSGSIATGSKKDSALRHEEHLAHCLLPLMSIFQLDEYVRDNPPSLSPAQVAAQVMPPADGDDEATEQAASAILSLDALLRSPAASSVLLEVLHTAQSTMAAADDDVKAAALSALKPQLQQAIDAALEKLVEAAAHSTNNNDSEQPMQAAKQEGGAEEDDAEGALPGAAVSQSPLLSSLFEDKTAHYFFKRLLAHNAAKLAADGSTSGAKRQLDDAASFTPTPASALQQLGQQFAQRLLQTFTASPAVLLAAADSNRGCFVLLALIDALDANQQTALAQLAKQHSLLTAIDAALSRQQHEQDTQKAEQPHGQQTGAGPTKKRKRTNRKPAAPADAGERSAAVTTGCKLLRGWIEVKQQKQEQVAKQPAANGHGIKASAASVKQGVRGAGPASQGEGSAAALTKRTRTADRK